ncbi:hypothetical protein [Ilumatobacter coccineus]|uniref:Uncharacterized protein n=1 Tax=Ilumatobacter coccineus (strain NBRC 103263 / KCTC 29153 / YM16-304) TaxID=1313172 RepID=A0A6C7DZX7_ILUCY|nr:hypothetical protein [Ilumatobacter coccineus]BAN00351.1 hypothetical protein YM304_00370 [Ilumatobacter coccineus YM16-304]
MFTTARHPSGTRRRVASGLALLVIGAAACGDDDVAVEDDDGNAEQTTSAPDSDPESTEPTDTDPVDSEPTGTNPANSEPTGSEPAESVPSDTGAAPTSSAPPATSAPRGSAMIDVAVADMAQRRGIDADSITVVSSQDVTWRDGSIGCPRKDMSYTMALVPGTRIVLEAGEYRDVYHSGNGGDPFYCAVPQEPLDAVSATNGGASGDI